MAQQQEQEKVSVAETVIADDTVFQYEPVPVPPSTTEIKAQRLVQIKQSLEAKLQLQLAEASRIRKMSTTAKTDYKRKFYDKKFSRINKDVRESVLAIQQVQYLISKNVGEGDAANGNTGETTN